MMTARVAGVLPSGDLVVEGVREIGINGERQMVVLTGVVRPVDVGPSNVVSSTAIGQLRIQYFGQGLMKDSLSPGGCSACSTRSFEMRTTISAVIVAV